MYNWLLRLVQLGGVIQGFSGLEYEPQVQIASLLCSLKKVPLLKIKNTWYLSCHIS